MKSFIDKFSGQISGVISCFDRMVFKGYLPLGYHRAMEGLLSRQNVLIKDFKKLVATNPERIRLHAQAVAERLERPFEYVDNSVRKEDLARKIAQQDGVTQG